MKNKPDKNDRYQDRLSAKPQIPGELNGYEANFLPTPAPGPHQTQEDLAKALDLHFFTPKRLAGTRQQFQSRFTRSESSLLAQLEACLVAYATSATAADEALLRLKRSVMEANEELKNAIIDGHHCLCVLDPHKEELQRSITSSPGLDPDFLHKYASITRETVKATMVGYAKFLEGEMPDFSYDYEGIAVFRGISNDRYYGQPLAAPDFLSLYTAAPGETSAYWEPRIFNSYSLSSDCSERFMVRNRNQRRAMVRTTYAGIERRLFASFITSPSFLEGQYELLTLAHETPTRILVEDTDPDYSVFRLW